ncbi:hypothetical protein AAMO2058_000891600 [Amorphochlora amoebiformis]
MAESTVPEQPLVSPFLSDVANRFSGIALTPSGQPITADHSKSSSRSPIEPRSLAFGCLTPRSDHNDTQLAIDHVFTPLPKAHLFAKDGRKKRESMSPGPKLQAEDEHKPLVQLPPLAPVPDSRDTSKGFPAGVNKRTTLRIKPSKLDTERRVFRELSNSSNPVRPELKLVGVNGRDKKERAKNLTRILRSASEPNVIFRSRSNPFPLSLSRQRSLRSLRACPIIQENLNATELVATSHVDYTTSLESIQAVYLSRESSVSTLSLEPYSLDDWSEPRATPISRDASNLDISSSISDRKRMREFQGCSRLRKMARSLSMSQVPPNTEEDSEAPPRRTVSSDDTLAFRDEEDENRPPELTHSVSESSMKTVSCSEISESNYLMAEVKLLLPLSSPKCDDRRIDPETLVDLFTGNFKEHFDSWILIDCRYSYEYEGGHLPGAVNILLKDQLKSFFKERAQELKSSKKRVAVIFHCEYSKHRGPKAARYFRQCDREENTYPYLTFPQLYILNGGYNRFYKKYPLQCQGKYVSMFHPDHQDKCRRETADHRRSWKGRDKASKTSKTRERVRRAKSARR